MAESVPVTLRLPTELYAKAACVADGKNLSMSVFMRLALIYYLKEIDYYDMVELSERVSVIADALRKHNLTKGR